MRHGHADLDVVTPRSTYYDHGRFGRMFPTLPPFAADTPSIRAALMDLGAAGGPMDAHDPVAPPLDLITNPELSAGNLDNPSMTAGMTFLGQFLDHDLTFDPTSSLARQQDPESIRNFRIPALDLDSVYGGGPGVSPHLYDVTVDGGRTTFLLEGIPGSETVSSDGVARTDLPRNSQNVALIGDPRNDENLVVSQLHLAMLAFHNAAMADVRADIGATASHEQLFAESQRIVRWHYQWLVVHEFLAKTCGRKVVEDVLTAGRKHYTWRHQPFVPVEWSVAAYRFGHSQVRPSYRANFGSPPTHDPFVALIFDPASGGTDPGDLRGGRRAARRFIDWQTFFDFGDGNARPNKAIDTKLSSVLFSLMGMASGTPESLAQRNLLRNLSMKVPSGQRVARAMRLPQLSRADLADFTEQDLDRRTPLWLYVLKEAEITRGGKRLGPVGARIVAEVMIGLIEGDPTSYLIQDPEWRPEYGTDDSFQTTDLLTKAGVVRTL